MRTLFTLLLILYLNPAETQWNLKNDTELGFIRADQNEIHTQDINLKGQVKEIHIISPLQGDSIIYKFNKPGKLTSQTNLSMLNQKVSVRHQYGYRNDSLVGIMVTYGNPSLNNGLVRKELKRFKNGYLHLFTRDYRKNDQSNVVKSTRKYRYNKDFSQASIKYTYKGNTDGQWLPQDGSLEFNFDSTGRLIKERSVTNYGESVHGYSVTFSYKNQNSPNHVTHKSDCAGSNSCLDTDLEIKYNEMGQVIDESLTDHTIRNSTWSYSYHKSIEYNEHGDIISLEHAQDPMMSRIMALSVSGQFRYDYDEQGNWIKKWRINSGEPKLVISRQITYYP